MLHECCASHVSWVIWNAKYDGVVFIFRLDPRKGQCNVKQIKLVQISKIKNFFQKHSYTVQFRFRIQKMLFLCTAIRKAKIAFQKGDVITFTALLYHCTAKKGCYFEIWYVFCLYVAL